MLIQTNPVKTTLKELNSDGIIVYFDGASWVTPPYRKKFNFDKRPAGQVYHPGVFYTSPTIITLKHE